MSIPRRALRWLALGFLSLVVCRPGYALRPSQTEAPAQRARFSNAGLEEPFEALAEQLYESREPAERLATSQ